SCVRGACEALRDLREGPRRVPGSRGPARTPLTRPAHVHLPRPVSPRARPEDQERAAPALGPGSRGGVGRAGGSGLVLRIGWHLQPHAARDGDAAPAPEGGPRARHQGGGGRDRQSRVHSPDPGRTRRPRREDRCAASRRDPRSRLRRPRSRRERTLSTPDSTPLEHKATAPRAVGCWVLTVSDTKTPETDTSGMLIRKLLTEAGHPVVGSSIVRDEPKDVQRGIREAWARAAGKGEGGAG